MTTFDQREQAFEHKFGHDEELKFKARARKNKMLGLWAAGLIAKTGAAAGTDARAIWTADFEKPGARDRARALMHDLAPPALPTAQHTSRRRAARPSSGAR